MTEVNIILFITICTTLSVSSFFIRSSRSLFSRYIVLLQFLIVTIFLLVRDPTASSDYNNYKTFYDNTVTPDSILDAYSGDYVFAIFNFIGQAFNLDTETYFLIFPIICLSLSLLALTLLVEKRYLPIAFGFLVINPGFILLFTNALRQGLSVPFLMLGIAFYLKQKKIISYFLFIASIFSHSAAIPIIFAFGVTIQLAKKRDEKQIIKFAILIMFLTLVATLLASLAPSVIIAFANLGGPLTKIERYYGSGYSSQVFYIKLLFAYFLSCINIYFFKKYSISSIKPYKILLFIQLCIFVVFIASPIPLISSRLLYYPELIVSAIIPYTYKFFQKISGLKYFNFYILWVITAIIGSFVYLFPSIRANIGL